MASPDDPAAATAISERVLKPRLRRDPETGIADIDQANRRHSQNDLIRVISESVI